MRKSAFSIIIRHPIIEEDLRSVPSTNRYWWGIDFDPRDGHVTNKGVETKAIELKVNQTEVRRRFELLADKLESEFGLELKLDWRD